MGFIIIRGLNDDLVIRAIISITAGKDKVDIGRFFRKFDRITEAPSLAHFVEENLEDVPIGIRNKFLNNSIAFKVDGRYVDLTYGISGPRANYAIPWDSPSRYYN